MSWPPKHNLWRIASGNRKCKKCWCPGSTISSSDSTSLSWARLRCLLRLPDDSSKRPGLDLCFIIPFTLPFLESWFPPLSNECCYVRRQSPDCSEWLKCALSKVGWVDENRPLSSVTLCLPERLVWDPFSSPASMNLMGKYLLSIYCVRHWAECWGSSGWGWYCPAFREQPFWVEWVRHRTLKKEHRYWEER